MRHAVKWIRHRDDLRLAAVVAVVVGTVLNLINQYELLLGAPLTPRAVAQLALTYSVPFLVSLHGQASGSSDRHDGGGSANRGRGAATGPDGRGGLKNNEHRQTSLREGKNT